jgi:hypothetical protein
MENVERWTGLISKGDVVGLHRTMTGLDRSSIEMREVSPFSGLLPDPERVDVLRELRITASGRSGIAGEVAGEEVAAAAPIL